MKLSRDIVFFDVETTGLDISKDRIIQIGAIKILTDGSTEEKQRLINPEMKIPEASTAIHGITNDMVDKEPTFRQLSKGLYEWLQGCDLGGYNSDNFDIPILIEEFHRTELRFPLGDVNFVDVLKVERLISSHRLEATYKRYTGEELEGAHDAMADIRATLKVFEKQMEKHPDLPDSPLDLDLKLQGEKRRVDYSGKLYESEGDVFWNFGKHRGERVLDTASYADWVLSKDFPDGTKEKLREILGK